MGINNFKRQKTNDKLYRETTKDRKKIIEFKARYSYEEKLQPKNTEEENMINILKECGINIRIINNPQFKNEIHNFLNNLLRNIEKEGLNDNITQDEIIEIVEKINNKKELEDDKQIDFAIDVDAYDGSAIIKKKQAVNRNNNCYMDIIKYSVSNNLIDVIRKEKSTDINGEISRDVLENEIIYDYRGMELKKETLFYDINSKEEGKIAYHTIIKRNQNDPLIQEVRIIKNIKKPEEDGMKYYTFVSKNNHMILSLGEKDEKTGEIIKLSGLEDEFQL